MAILQRKCRECNQQFEGGPRAYYCTRCRVDRKREQIKKSKETIGRKMGSKDLCERCGKQYIVTAALQRFCKPCQKLHKLEHDRKRKLEYYNNNKETNNPKRNKTRTENYAKLSAVDKELVRQQRREWRELQVLARIIKDNQLYDDIKDFALDQHIKNTNISSVRPEVKRINTSTAVTMEEYYKIKYLANRTGLPISKLVRLGLKIVLDYYEHLDKQQD